MSRWEYPCILLRLNEINLTHLSWNIVSNTISYNHLQSHITRIRTRVWLKDWKTSYEFKCLEYWILLFLVVYIYFTPWYKLLSFSKRLSWNPNYRLLLLHLVNILIISLVLTKKYSNFFWTLSWSLGVPELIMKMYDCDLDISLIIGNIKTIIYRLSSSSHIDRSSYQCKQYHSLFFFTQNLFLFHF